MATNFNILAWRIPRTEELGGLQSMGSQRVRHDWATHTHTLKASYVQASLGGHQAQRQHCWKQGGRVAVHSFLRNTNIITARRIKREGRCWTRLWVTHRTQDTAWGLLGLREGNLLGVVSPSKCTRTNAERRDCFVAVILTLNCDVGNRHEWYQ